MRLREATDAVERIGIEVSEKYLGWANIVLACGDSDLSLSQVLATLDGKASTPVIRIRTKADLVPVPLTDVFDVKVSAETGEGLSDLIDLIDKALASSVGNVVVDTPILTRSRHIHGITQARSEIEGFAKAWSEEELPAPVAAVHLRSATVALESLIGAVSTEDVLDRVFSSFCVGK